VVAAHLGLDVTLVRPEHLDGPAGEQANRLRGNTGLRGTR
jgi:hypothetical protein